MASARIRCQTSWCILVATWLPIIIMGCNDEGLQVCVYNEELKNPAVSVMFKQEYSQYQLTCRRQEEFLNCASNWRLKHASGCNQGHLAGLAAFENVHKAVCRTNETAYNRSRPCILGVEEDVNRCLRIFARAKEYQCEEMEEARACVESVKHELCDDVDKVFLVKVTDLSLIPFAHPQSFNCEISAFVGEQKKKTTPEAKATIQVETFPESTVPTTKPTTKSTTKPTTKPTTKVTHLADKEEAKTADNNDTRSLHLIGDNSSSRLSPSTICVTALFVTFLSVHARLVL